MNAEIFADPTAACHALAHAWADLVTSAPGPRVSIALTGGNTPRQLYAHLAEAYGATLPWPKTQLFFGDERCVPPEHPDSNFGNAHATLLRHVPIPEANVHRMRGELPPATGAQAYEATLRGYFGTVPSFDLVLLGMGEDGHVASLFPNHPVLNETQRWVRDVHAPEVVVPWRLTLTLPLLQQARQVWFLVTGAKKAPVVRAILDDATAAATRYPAARVQPGTARWFLDAAAAGR